MVIAIIIISNIATPIKGFSSSRARAWWWPRGTLLVNEKMGAKLSAASSAAPPDPVAPLPPLTAGTLYWYTAIELSVWLQCYEPTMNHREIPSQIDSGRESHPQHI